MADSGTPEHGGGPSLGEVNRNLIRVTQALEMTQRDLHAALRDISTTYLRKDVYDLAHEVVVKDVQEVNQRLDKQEAYRRTITSGVAVGGILLLVNLLIAVSNYIARGG